MIDDHYTRVALDENDSEKYEVPPREEYSKFNVTKVLGGLVVAMLCFLAGFGVGEILTLNSIVKPSKQIVPGLNGLLDPQSFIPDIPIVDTKFQFPTGFEDVGESGDRMWNEMMPVGAGFLRVPFPRSYDTPPSKVIEGDHELAEIYSMSMTHQLHCLGVLRHVIMKYEVGDKSRFAGDGHEYHCLDYLRQAVLCAGDTTLDHADIVLDANGSDRMSGFSGANSTHQCRDWETIKTFLIDNRSGDNRGILI